MALRLLWVCAGGGDAMGSLSAAPEQTTTHKPQTHGSEAVARAGGGALGELAAFASMGRQMVAAQGPAALFAGMAPRLMQQVPSSTICWLVIEQCRALLEPYTKA